MSLPVLVIAALGLVLSVRSIAVLTRESRLNPLVVPLTLFILVSQLGQSYVGTLVASKVSDGLSATALTQVLCLGLLAVLVFIAAGTRAHRTGSTRLTPPAVLIVIATGALFAVDLFEVGDATLPVLMSRLLAFVTVVAFAQIATSSGISIEALAASVALTLGGAMLATAISPAPTRACSKFKCGPFGAQIRGPFDNENAFGFLAVVAIVLAIKVGDSWLTRIIYLSGFFILFATDSRTSQISVICGLIAGLSWRYLGPQGRTVMKPLLMALPVALAAIGLRLVYTAKPADFSNRGIIWGYGRNALKDHVLTGRGIDSWSIDALDRSYMHSQYFMLLYSGGPIAVVAFILAMVGIMLSLKGAADSHAVALLVAVLVMSLTEVVWNLIGIERGALVGLLLIALAVRRPEADPVPEDGAGPPTALEPEGRVGSPQGQPT